MTTEKTHFRKAFDSPYVGSADLVEPTILTISHVRLEPDHTKKTKEVFNTAFFVEQELRRGEKLKPMILNASNSKTMRTLAGSPYIDDWKNIRVTIYVDPQVKFGREVVEGLRISPHAPEKARPVLTPANAKRWAAAKAAYLRDGNLNAVLEHMDISSANESALIAEANAEGRHPEEDKGPSEHEQKLVRAEG